MTPNMDLFALLAVAWASVSQGQLPPIDIVKLLISKGLGYGIMAGACITKVPQIQVVLRKRSAEGLSSLSYELEALALLIHSSYGYLRGLPFNTYGEAAILEVQTLVLLALVYLYSRTSSTRVMLVTAVFAGLVGVVLSGSLAQEQVQAAFEFNTVIMMAARVPQIWKNFTAKSTGQLAMFTYVINVVGCIVRIFTTIQEGTGSAMLRQYCISLFLNATLVAQILLYKGHAPASKKQAKTRGKAAAAAAAAAAGTKEAKKQK